LVEIYLVIKWNSDWIVKTILSIIIESDELHLKKALNIFLGYIKTICIFLSHYFYGS